MPSWFYPNTLTCRPAERQALEAEVGSPVRSARMTGAGTSRTPSMRRVTTTAVRVTEIVPLRNLTARRIRRRSSAVLKPKVSGAAP